MSTKSQKIFTREVFALPYCYLENFKANCNENAFKIPRGSIRQQLVLHGLSAKVALSKQQHQREVHDEISKLFLNCFVSNGNDRLNFTYLSSLPGTKVLTAPKVNQAFCWDAAAVLGLHRSTIYIAISEEHPLVKNLFNGSTVVLPSEDASIIAS